MESLALFVIGHSPAIVTETLAALSSRGKVIDGVRIITTQTGAELLSRRLFEDGAWKDFCHAWPGMAETCLTEESILFPDGLEDIRSEADNRFMAELILEETRRAIEDSDVLFASLAGGRKTMGYYLGFAMSLFAREADSMSHVLVPPEWERDAGFRFPTKEQAVQVELVDVPFIRLRHHLRPSLANADVGALADSAQTAIDMAALQPISLHIRRRMVRYMGKEIVFSEREFSIYQFFTQQKLRHCREADRMLCGECRACFLSVDDMDAKKEELFAVRVQFGGVDNGNYARFVNAWSVRRAASDNLPEPLRRISSEVEKTFGADPRSAALLICNIGKRNQTAYGLMADKTQVRIERE